MFSVNGTGGRCSGGNIPHVFISPDVKLTCEHAQDAAADRDLGLRLVGGRADLDALQAEQSHDHGAKAEQQRHDHQGTTRRDVSCRGGRDTQHDT